MIHEEKILWHDLTEDPKDLPRDPTKEYVVHYQYPRFGEMYDCVFSNVRFDGCRWYILDNEVDETWLDKEGVRSWAFLNRYDPKPIKKHVVFISTPMAGLSDAAIHMNIESAKMAYLKEHPEWNIQNTAFVHNKDADIPFKTIHEKPALLAQAFKKISQCDEVCFFGKWIYARGCLMEYELCRLYDIPYTIADLEDDK